MKLSHVALSALVAALTLVFSFGLAQGDDAEALESIDEFVQRYIDAYNRQDAAEYRQLFTEDAQFMPANEPLVDGRDALMEYFALAPENVGTFELLAETTEAKVFGDMAYGQGTTTVKDAEGQVLDEGKWMAVYKQQDGGWRVYRLISNSNLPIPEAAASNNTMSGGGN